MIFGSERERAFAKLNRDLKKVAKKNGTEVNDIVELANNEARYPELIPTLVDWYGDVDSKTTLSDPRDRAQFLDAISRSLITREARGTNAFALAVRYLESHPCTNQSNFQGAGILVAYLAKKPDTEDMIRLACDRYLGEARVPILDWLLRSKKPDLIDVAVGELADSPVAAHIMRELRKLSYVPVGIEDLVRSYLQCEQEESRKQARLLLPKMGK